VRPPREPVPAALGDGSAGALFGRLVRMNEGAAHAQARPVLERALAGIAPEAAAAMAHALVPPTPAADWTLTLPVRVVASLLGFDAGVLPALAAAVADFVAGIAPRATPAQVDAAHAAATRLVGDVQRLLAQAGSGTLAAAAQREAAGWHDTPALVANLVGLLSQTCEATAGLLGNALVACARDPAIARQAAHPGFIDEVARFDAPVQNTRRWAAEASTIDGCTIDEGDAVLVVLGAANRDPAANVAPDEFVADRRARRVYTYGLARHACPGRTLAAAIAAAATRAALARGLAPGLSWRYRPSANGRIPIFDAA
jgi:cytochrome P450